MKRTETFSVAEVFKQMLEEEPDIHEHLLKYQAISLIPNIFGSISRYIGSCTIDNGILYMEIHSGAVKQAILLDKRNLIARINQDIKAELLRDLEIINITKTK